MDGFVVGVDGCRSGWLICRDDISAPSVTFRVLSSFAEILELEHGAIHIAIDIPIGLTEDNLARHCDTEARRLLAGPRASSIFPAPARSLLSEENYSAACDRSRILSGKAVSKQAFAIYGKIAEVDRSMNPELQRQVFEVHPEICFWGIERCAMRFPKKTPLGYEERRRLLAGVLPFPLPDRGQIRRLSPGAEPEDFLDSAVAAVSAYRAALGTAGRLPRAPQLDRNGLRMGMVY